MGIITPAIHHAEEKDVFSIVDIRNIAVQIERNGEETYRNAGRASTDPEVAAILARMAEDERRHAEWFAAIRSKKPLSEEQREMEAVGRTLLQDMVRGNTFLLEQSELERAKTVAEVLARAKVFEQDTILFYQFIQGLLEEPDTAHWLEKIIAEERNHIRQLDRLEQMQKDGRHETAAE
jgi:rubrerythrin